MSNRDGKDINSDDNDNNINAKRIMMNMSLTIQINRSKKRGKKLNI